MNEGASSGRVRTKVACLECRKNKRKCDGCEPTCSLCEKIGKPCVYISDTQKRKRKRRDEEYIRTLEDEIETLRSLLNLEKTKTAQDTLAAYSHQNPQAAHQYENEYEDVEIENSQQSTSESLTDVVSAEAMSELGSLMLSLNIEDQGEPSFTLASGRLKPIDMLPQAMSIEEASGAYTTKPSAFDDLELLSHLRDCFLKYFNPNHQTLSPQDILDFNPEGFWSQTLDRNFRDSAIYAIGARYSERYNNPVIEEQMANFARSLLFECLQNYSSVFVVQGCSLMAWRELMTGNNSMSFNYICFATGLALKMGLHVTALSRIQSRLGDTRASEYARQVRTFWCYFSIDRIITAVIGMNCTIPWQRVRVAPFSDIVSGSLTLDDIIFDRQGQLWHLWDSLMDQVLAFNWRTISNEEKQALLIRSRQALLSFLRDSDERLRIDDENSPKNVICFRMAFQAALLLIHRPFICESGLGPLLQLSIRSVTAAANSITHLTRTLKKIDDFAHVPPEVIGHMTSASVIHLLNATSGKTTLGRQSVNRLATCLNALVAIRRTWDVRASTSIRFIQDLAARWKVVWALPLSLSSPLPDHMRTRPSIPLDPLISSFVDAGPATMLQATQQDMPVPILDQYYGEMDVYAMDSMALNWLFGVTDDELTGQ
ncbi:hypothetical protein BP6252_02743 [Coleophoma cylindrospora]|uniref:Zn(2)-C6 fungal-type domain-containing protein n=1 Tax=Coleophoma cylindrospora TaxID=1849047 RepID=A0A3D8SFU8_9HELO|nr:hypothetical protein BP6252_02743 [Coleophoma cylindrospora]